jgi:hypothetical protein
MGANQIMPRGRSVPNAEAEKKTQTKRKVIVVFKDGSMMPAYMYTNKNIRVSDYLNSKNINVIAFSDVNYKDKELPTFLAYTSDLRGIIPME